MLWQADTTEEFRITGELNLAAGIMPDTLCAVFIKGQFIHGYIASLPVHPGMRDNLVPERNIWGSILACHVVTRQKRASGQADGAVQTLLTRVHLPKRIHSVRYR